jgi:regulator of PEP synthase PpsR (kinase-PPPase family)
MSVPERPRIYVVSDGRGGTCQRVIDAALVQFRGLACETVRCTDIQTPEQVEEVVGRAASDRGVVFYTLVSRETREAMHRATHRLLVPAVDILGPALSALDDLFQSAPEAKPGLLYEAHREHYDRVEAMQFALLHDDGQNPQELPEADVVLVGVSRSSKTSTCFYLAYAGVRAANVPLIPDVEPPRELLRLPPERVIGLRINTHRLMAIRQARWAGKDLRRYRDKRAVAHEVIEAMRLMERKSWRSIDVSYRAVEEIASWVMDMRGLKRRRG